MADQWPTPVTDALVADRRVLDSVAEALGSAWANRDPLRGVLPPSEKERALRRELAENVVLLGALLLDFLAAPQKQGGEPAAAGTAARPTCCEPGPGTGGTAP
jgi:hypothetical protein